MQKPIGLALVACLGLVIAVHAPLLAGEPVGSLLAPSEVNPAEQFSPCIGRWNSEFANGIHEVHELRADGTVTVSNLEQKWSCEGRLHFDGTAVTITYDNERLERWTPVGSRMVLEHWRPASQIPIQPAMFGIATRAE